MQKLVTIVFSKTTMLLSAGPHPLKCPMTAASRNDVRLAAGKTTRFHRSAPRRDSNLSFDCVAPPRSSLRYSNSPAHRLVSRKASNSLCQPNVLLLLFIAFPLYVICSLTVVPFTYFTSRTTRKACRLYIQETTGYNDPRGTTLVDTLYVRKRAGTPTLSIWPTPDVDSNAPDYGG